MSYVWAVAVGAELPLDVASHIDALRVYLPLSSFPAGYGLAFVMNSLLVVLLLPLYWGVKRLLRPFPGLPFDRLVRALTFALLVLVLVKQFKLWAANVAPIVNQPLFDFKWWIALVVVAIALPIGLRPGVEPVARRALLVLLLPGLLMVPWAAATAFGKAIQAPIPFSVAPAKTAGLPPVLLITLDALSAQRMQVYGGGRANTPRLMEFAGQATVFDRFYANSNFTTSGVGAFIHGVRPWTHRAFQYESTPLPNVASGGLIPALHGAGYRIYAVSTNPLASPLQHLVTPYTERTSVRNLEPPKFLYNFLFIALDPNTGAFINFGFIGKLIALANPLLARAGFWRENTHYDPRVAFGAALDMLASAPNDRPVFLWVHIMPPHAPYATPAGFLGTYNNSARARTRVNSSPNALIFATERNIGILADRYDESILYADHAVGAFLDQLKQAGWFDRSIIAISTDHGELFSEEARGHAGPLLREALVHVPLIVRVPGQTAGRRVGQLAEQIDLAPTLLALAGVPADPRLEGISLVPAMQGRELAARPVFIMNFQQNPRLQPIRTGTVAMIDGDWKYVHYLPGIRYPFMPRLEDQLLNLKDDPGEKSNQIASHPAIAARMLGEINAKLRQHSAPQPDR
jgi:arylsulfatase A-like enzyme